MTHRCEFSIEWQSMDERQMNTGRENICNLYFIWQRNNTEKKPFLFPHLFTFDLSNVYKRCNYDSLHRFICDRHFRIVILVNLIIWWYAWLLLYMQLNAYACILHVQMCGYGFMRHIMFLCTWYLHHQWKHIKW